MKIYHIFSFYEHFFHIPVRLNANHNIQQVSFFTRQRNSNLNLLLILTATRFVTLNSILCLSFHRQRLMVVNSASGWGKGKANEKLDWIKCHSSTFSQRSFSSFCFLSTFNGKTKKMGWCGLRRTESKYLTMTLWRKQALYEILARSYYMTSM